MPRARSCRTSAQPEATANAVNLLLGMGSRRCLRRPGGGCPARPLLSVSLLAARTLWRTLLHLDADGIRLDVRRRGGGGVGRAGGVLVAALFLGDFLGACVPRHRLRRQHASRTAARGQEHAAAGHRSCCPPSGRRGLEPVLPVPAGRLRCAPAGRAARGRGDGRQHHRGGLRLPRRGLLPGADAHAALHELRGGQSLGPCHRVVGTRPSPRSPTRCTTSAIGDQRLVPDRGSFYVLVASVGYFSGLARRRARRLR